MSTFTTSVQYCTGVSRHAGKGGKEGGKKGRKEERRKGTNIVEVKLYLFTDHIIVYLENPIEWKKILKLISEFSGSAG